MDSGLKPRKYCGRQTRKNDNRLMPVIITMARATKEKTKASDSTSRGAWPRQLKCIIYYNINNYNTGPKRKNNRAIK